MKPPRWLVICGEILIAAPLLLRTGVRFFKLTTLQRIYQFGKLLEADEDELQKRLLAEDGSRADLRQRIERLRRTRASLARLDEDLGTAADSDPSRRHRDPDAGGAGPPGKGDALSQ